MATNNNDPRKSPGSGRNRESNVERLRESVRTPAIESWKSPPNGGGLAVAPIAPRENISRPPPKK